MARKKKTSWIHRWARPLIAGIATIGAVVTAYLTIHKLTGTATACPTEGCDIVLSSPYATVFGLPLALFGFLAYAGMGVLAVLPLLVQGAKQRDLHHKLTTWTQPLLLIGGTAMVVFSGYLMYLLAFQLKALCIYCLGSAILSTCLFLLAGLGQDWADFSQPIFIGLITAVVVLVGTLGVYANINTPTTAHHDNPIALGPAVTTTSGESEIALAKHLAESGAMFYGAWWCPHCHEQKQLFGEQAMPYIPYTECSLPDGQGQTEACQKAEITGYPTWQINGERLVGPQPLEKLAKLSGYQGPMDFKNSLSP